jgi:hypothetical protein
VTGLEIFIACTALIIVLSLTARWQRRRAGNMDTAVLLLLLAAVLWVLGGIALIHHVLGR